MAWIRTVSEEQAHGLLAEIYDEIRRTPAFNGGDTQRGESLQPPA